MNIKRIVIIGVSFLILMVFLFFGPPALYEKTSTPAFCASCHVMETQHEAWFMEGLHREIDCVDCHLPNTNFISHLIWKGIDGTRDVIYFYGRLYDDIIRATSHGKSVVQQNCVRCHGDMVSRIEIEGRNCWDCHRRVQHTYPAISFKK